MTRVLVIVEGHTEAAFINNVLAHVFWSRNVFLQAVLLGVPGHKGGNLKYARVKRDVLRILKQSHTVFCSTMIDLYGLGSDFPGLPFTPGLTGAQKATHIEAEMSKEIYSAGLRTKERFLPYIQVHEYEGLLFSDPDALATSLGQIPLKAQFRQICNQYTTPEDINDSAETAPSKRITKHFPSYDKRIQGALAAQAVGIETMRRECPHFRNWLEQLEGIHSGARLPLDLI